MKTFEDICRMTQAEVKEYMHGYLSSKKYKVINEDGFLYAKGTVPILLVAHMDTVHKEQCNIIENKNGVISSPQGIGGDDRCGVFIIMNLLKEYNCSVLLCEEEEKGGVGARKFIKTDYINNLDVNFMIEFDRNGNNDAVFYSCDNKDFIKFVEDNTNFFETGGSFSDISVLMPAAKLAAVNLSSGYYKAHTPAEYVIYEEMFDTIDAAKNLIDAECNEPFEYVEKKYDWSKWYSSGKYANNYDGPRYKSHTYIGGESQKSMFDLIEENESKADAHVDEKLYNMAKKDKEIELEVIITDFDNEEIALYAQGSSKTECWMNFFMDNPNVCFNNVVDYSWC